jgi:outer membrane biosynthesis protein TonB
VQVTELNDLRKSDAKLFSISQPTPPNQQLRSATVPEEELRNQALQPLEIIWPQVLDGATSGKTSYYVCVDRSGNVREVLPLSVAVERADRPAERQIAGWKFKPVLQDGVPVQAEAIMNFDFNTRAYGPAAPLTDSEARKMASGIVEPIYPPEP